MFGRHFDIDDELVSRISRKSIDVLKANYRVGNTTTLVYMTYHKISANWE